MNEFLLEDEVLIQKYQVITSWSDEDGVFIAEMPELPGCLSDGPTEADAQNNIQLVAQEWIDTARLLSRPVPEPQQAAVSREKVYA